MLYTSSYARKGDDPNAIGINVKPPSDFTGAHIRNLAPTWKMVLSRDEGILSNSDYRAMYFELLEERQFDPYDFLQAFDDGDEYFLLCYGRPGDNNSHRRFLTEYIKIHTGFEIPEWWNKREQKLMEQKQLVDNLLDW